MTWTLLHGDCREVLATMDDGSVHAVVTDPPYGLEFMGKDWDSFKVGRSANYKTGGELHDPADRRGKGGAGPSYTKRPAKRCATCGRQAWSGSPCTCEQPAWEIDNSPLFAYQLWFYEIAAEVLRVLKPGGHLLAFGGTRTYHRMTVAIEDAGFEVRDSIHWVYGSGFPKSLDVSKAIDKADTGTAAAAEWDGFGTALKPAHEPIVVARKPLAGTVATNVLEYGTGALNIDGCRVAGADAPLKWETPRGGIWQTDPTATATATTDDRGRWPANFVLTHAADCGDDCAPGCPVAALDEQSGELPGAGSRTHRVDRSPFTGGEGDLVADRVHDAGGGASRFFTVTEWDDGPFRYVAKPSRAERNAGTDRNIHPTVKPLDLMRWLVRLVTPPGGVVLDPFAGSGTTLAAAILEGFDCVGVEMTDDYLPLIEGRCAWAEKAARFGPVTGRPKTDVDDTPTLFDVEDDK